MSKAESSLDNDVMLSATDLSSDWLFTYRKSTRVQARLFCFPFAGAGASVFENWPDALPGLDVIGIQLPGREDRFAEAPLHAMDEVVEPLADALDGFLDIPFAFFGHSTGAMIAFELSRVLRRRARAQPQVLLVASQNGPRIRPTFFRHRLPDEEFIQVLRELGGVPPSILDDPAITQSLLPRIRADGAIAEQYKYLAEPPLNTRIVLLQGEEDPFMSTEGAEAWRHEGALGFDAYSFRGGHFFLTENEVVVVERVLLELRKSMVLGDNSSAEAERLQAKSYPTHK